MNIEQITKQITLAAIEAEGARRLFSELGSRYVRNGQGMMTQRYFAELLAARNAA